MTALTFSYYARYQDGRPIAPTSAEFEGRTLLIIDPEDREQVDRLNRAQDAEYARRGIDVVDHEGVGSDVMQAALRSLIAPPQVYSHQQLFRDQDGGIQTALCGKVWKPSSNVTVVGRCPECVAASEAGWIA